MQFLTNICPWTLNSMDKLKYSWTIFPQNLNTKYFMDIGHVTWTLATTHGQLSVANRCPWPIVHEIDKTLHLYHKLCLTR